MATTDLKDLLRDIYVDRGRLDGETVVDLARDPNHPLHDRFEWDDSKAAHQFRVVQANRLIRSVKIETTPPSQMDGPHYVRAFVSNRQTGDPSRNGYSPIDEVVQDELAYAMLLRSFQRQVNELHRRYGHLKEYAQIMQEQANAS